MLVKTKFARYLKFYRGVLRFFAGVRAGKSEGVTMIVKGNQVAPFFLFFKPVKTGVKVRGTMHLALPYYLKELNSRFRGNNG